MNTNTNIEELLTRYFQADTTVSEERLLREYFASGDVPQHLHQYRALFQTLAKVTTETSQPQTAKTFSLRHTLLRIYRPIRPLVRAAACVAIVVTIGTAIDQGLTLNSNTIVLTPSNSQSVGVEVSEWNGLQVVECPSDTIFDAADFQFPIE